MTTLREELVPLISCEMNLHDFLCWTNKRLYLQTRKGIKSSIAFTPAYIVPRFRVQPLLGFQTHLSHVV